MKNEVRKEREKVVKSALQAIEKNFGVSVKKVGEGGFKPVEVISTGSLTLDQAIGIGGYPRGRLIEVYGPESGGKSLLSLLSIAEVQRKGGIAVLIDAEYSFDPIWAAKLGVDVDNLYTAQPGDAESAFDTIESLVKTNSVDIIVIDSVTSLAPKAEFEGKMEDVSVALLARLMSKALRRLVGAVSQSKTVVLFINQLRDKPMVLFGPSETTPGGRALKFYSSLRLKISKISRTEAKSLTTKDAIGHQVRVKVEKNKVGPPYREASFMLYYEKGVDTAGEIFLVALKKGLIKISGASYRYEDKKWFGQEKVKEALVNDEALRKELLKKIQEV